MVAEHLDHLHYLHDILSLNIQDVNDVLTGHFINRLLIPLYIYSLVRKRPDMEQVNECTCSVYLPWYVNISMAKGAKHSAILLGRICKAWMFVSVSARPHHIMCCNQIWPPEKRKKSHFSLSLLQHCRLNTGMVFYKPKQTALSTG